MNRIVVECLEKENEEETKKTVEEGRLIDKKRIEE